MYYDFYFYFNFIVKSRDEWTLEVMDSGIKYKMRGKKEMKSSWPIQNASPPTYASEAFIGNLSFFLLNTFSSSLLVLHAQDVCHSDEDWKGTTC